VTILERSARVGARSVRYFEAGAGRPVVLLHAFPLSADMWRPQLDRVPEGWRLLAPDVRGLGPDAATAAGTLDEMAADVIAWLDGLGIDRAVVGGASMGGYLTFALFRLVPDRFEGVILANTRAGADSAEGRAGRDKMSALVRVSGASAVADQMIPKLLGDTSRRTRPHLEPLVRTLIEANGVEGIDGAIQAMKNRPDSTGMLPSMEAPALIISGAEDTVIPQTDAELMMKRLPHACLVTIPDAGHLSNLEAPEAFSRALNDFLDGVPGRGKG
jgi:pimeloyl-ACP methyl ester carboxylesterase